MDSSSMMSFCIKQQTAYEMRISDWSSDVCSSDLHNRVIVSPGAADEVAQLAVDMGGKGFEEQFVPESEKVLQATRLINNNEAQTLEFTAPSQTGDYPFLCTFPAHSPLTRGVLKVLDRESMGKGKRESEQYETCGGLP